MAGPNLEAVGETVTGDNRRRRWDLGTVAAAAAAAVAVAAAAAAAAAAAVVVLLVVAVTPMAVHTTYRRSQQPQTIFHFCGKSMQL
jgi:hypothetical protein